MTSRPGSAMEWRCGRPAAPRGAGRMLAARSPPGRWRRWRQVMENDGWPADGSRLSNAGGKGSLALSASAGSVRHGDDEATGRGATEGKLRRTPTWRAKCRITGSGKTLNVQTLGCAQRSPPTDPRPSFAKISRANSRNSQHKGHKIYTGSGHRCCVIPYSGVVSWIASWANDEQYKGRTSSRGEAFLCLVVCLRRNRSVLYGGG